MHLQLRPVILARDPMCRGCCWRPSTVMEHAIPLEQGGETSAANCWGACKQCADYKTGVEQHDRTFGLRLVAAGAVEQHVVPWGWRSQRAFGGDQ